MKKILSLVLVLIVVLSLFVGCSGFNIEDIGYTVNVNFYVDGEVYKTVQATSILPISEPQAPARENMIFVGWYTDGVFSQRYDFSKPFLIETNLYAYYVLDAAKVTNMVTTQIMSSVVTVHTKSYNTAMGGLLETSSFTAQGSGVVIDISDGWCYVITNAHVVKREAGFDKYSIVIEDAWGNKYDAQIYKNALKAESAVSSDYDLALICFKYNPTTETKNLTKIVKGSDPKIGDYVVSLGTPGGQKNAVTYGKALEYSKINTQDGEESSVKFEIIVHGARIDRGSSGGPLLNARGELVGLNFGGYNDGQYGCAIPLSKINEFLNIFVYN